MDFPTVEVQEITDEQVALLRKEHNPRGVNLGGAHNTSAAFAEAQLNDLISQSRKLGGRKFLLIWEGNKVPRGARVTDYEISWTQNGQVIISTGVCIGTYDRLVEFGGATGKQQKMIVFLYPSKGK